LTASAVRPSWIGSGTELGEAVVADQLDLSGLYFVQSSKLDQTRTPLLILICP
jgi:hypothetical protein